MFFAPVALGIARPFLVRARLDAEAEAEVAFFLAAGGKADGRTAGRSQNCDVIFDPSCTEHSRMYSAKRNSF